MTALIIERNCGATTDYTRIVRVSGLSSGVESVFVVDGEPTIYAVWRTNRELSVQCAACVRAGIFREVSISGDLTVTFETAAAERRPGAFGN
jgi:hypothetical protein